MIELLSISYCIFIGGFLAWCFWSLFRNVKILTLEKDDTQPTQLEMEILYASNKAHGGIKCAAGHASQYGSYCRVCGVKIK